MNAAPLSLADARSLVASPLWPRIRAFLWDFASLCDPRRLSAAAEGSTRAPRAFEDASGIVPETSSASFEGGSAAVRSEEHSVQGTPAQPALNVREADLERAADAAPGTGGFAALANALAATPRVAASALRALGLSPFFHAFPATDSSRLLLLSREDYGRLAQFLGVVALAPALRRVTAGAEVRALKAALPDYRETLSFVAYFHRFEALFTQVAPADAAANAETVCAAGHALLAAALSGLAPELLLRQRLRFPADSPADAALGGASSPSEPQEAGHSSLVTRHSSLAGEALAATRLALKLSNPAESTALALSS